MDSKNNSELHDVIIDLRLALANNIDIDVLKKEISKHITRLYLIHRKEFILTGR